MKSEKKKSNKKKCVLIILGVIILIIAGISVWQADNIKAVIDAFNYSDEELSEKMKENKESLEKEVVEKYGVVGDFTEEEEEKILSGEMSVEEAARLKKEELDAKRSESEKSGNKGKTEAQVKTDNIVSERIIEFYSLKAYYLGQLGQMEAKVKADYAALPKEKKNLVGKKELVSKYMSYATSLLSQCDAKIAELTSKLEKEIKAVGGDPSIVNTIKASYEEEKNLKKSYYLSKMK